MGTRLCSSGAPGPGEDKAGKQELGWSGQNAVMKAYGDHGDLGGVQRGRVLALCGALGLWPSPQTGLDSE